MRIKSNFACATEPFVRAVWKGIPSGFGIDQNTMRDSGNVKRDTGFEQNTVWDAELRKIFGMAMTVALRDAEFS